MHFYCWGKASYITPDNILFLRDLGYRFGVYWFWIGRRSGNGGREGGD